MWTRSELKARAKEVLRGSYWKAFLVSLLLAIVTGSGLGSNNFSWNSKGDQASSPSMGGTRSTVEDALNSVGPDLWWIAAVVAAVGLIVLLIAIAFHVFLSNPLEVGARQYFKRAAEQEVNMNYLGFAFDKTRYMNIVIAMLWRGVLNFLWFLLLIIPGFVKLYAYSMVPYILSDNPNIGYRRAVTLSKEMTKGHKLRMLVLDLSFIGWYLLGMLLFFVGVLFVLPYINATQAELYLVLRQQALEKGMTNEEELRLTPPIEH
jgi:uncharacterized membrane protein